MSITYRGETFEKVNKPKRTPNHPKKSHAVLAKKAGSNKLKLVRFGQQGVSGAGSNPKSDKDKKRKRSFYARHSAQNPSGLRDKFSSLHWSARTKW